MEIDSKSQHQNLEEVLSVSLYARVQSNLELYEGGGNKKISKVHIE